MDLTQNLEDYFEGKFKELKDDLLKCESEKQIYDYMNWFTEKLKINYNFTKEEYILKEINSLNSKKDFQRIADLRREKRNYSHKDRPYDLFGGDIINIKFGIGIGHEIKNEHYGIILSRYGAMFLIAPLTSSPISFGKYTKRFKDLNLPRKLEDRIDDDISYVSFSQIRYIHSRRITKIKAIFGQKDYKEKLNINKKDVDDIIEKYFCILVDNMQIKE